MPIRNIHILIMHNIINLSTFLILIGIAPLQYLLKISGGPFIMIARLRHSH